MQDLLVMFILGKNIKFQSGNKMDIFGLMQLWFKERKNVLLDTSFQDKAQNYDKDLSRYD